MSSTTRKRASRGLDFYRTPAWCVAAIAPHLPHVPALDPCCGDGAILDALYSCGWGSDLLDGWEVDKERANAASAKGYSVKRADALPLDHEWWSPQLVVMNPPFSRAEAFVRKALAETSGGRGTVAALLRLAFLEGKARAELHREHPSDVYVLSRRPSFVGGKTDSCAYAWFIWGPGRGGRWSVL
jgi:hypothetical protein